MSMATVIATDLTAIIVQDRTVITVPGLVTMVRSPTTMVTSLVITQSLVITSHVIKSHAITSLTAIALSLTLTPTLPSLIATILTHTLSGP